jgi:hypothetical protein
MNAAILNAALGMGIPVVYVDCNEPKPLSLRDACIARGLDPASYKVPQQRLLKVDRIIPGVADRVSPCMDPCFKNRRNANPRKMYTRTSAQNDAAQIAEGGTVAYVAAFCRLNNLKGN